MVILLQCNHHLLFLSMVCIISWVKIQSNNWSSLFVGEWKWVSFDMISHLLNHYLKSCKYKNPISFKTFSLPTTDWVHQASSLSDVFPFFFFLSFERKRNVKNQSFKESDLFNVVEATCENFNHAAGCVLFGWCEGIQLNLNPCKQMGNIYNFRTWEWKGLKSTLQLTERETPLESMMILKWGCFSFCFVLFSVFFNLTLNVW